MLNEKNVIGVDWGPSKVTCEPMHGVPVEFRDFKDVFELTFPVVDPRDDNVWGCFQLIHPFYFLGSIWAVSVMPANVI